VTDREGYNRFIYLDLGKFTCHSFRKRKEKNVKRVFYYSRQINNK
jgi:hypothetical protein